MFKIQVTSNLRLDALRHERLNLGCGLKHVPDALNLDITPGVSPDVIHDLNRLPCLEHLDNFIAVMEEIHRVCRAGAVVRISVPHFSRANAYTDSTHHGLLVVS